MLWSQTAGRLEYESMRILFAALCLVAVMAVACGGDSSSEEGKIQAAVHTYFDHYINDEIEEIYPLLDAASQQNCPEDQFLSVMSDTRGAVGDHEIEFLEFTDVSIEGDHATVTTKLRFDEVTDTTENTLIKEGSDWKIQIRPEVCQG
jgi:hypothetical protein